MSTETMERWHGKPGQIGSFFLRVSGEPGSQSGRVTWADVEAWQVTATDVSGGEYYFGAVEEMKTTVAGVQPDVSGFIKWDGCSEISRRETHACNRAQAIRIGEVIGALYDLAEEFMRPDDRKMYRGEP